MQKALPSVVLALVFLMVSSLGAMRVLDHAQEARMDSDVTEEEPGGSAAGSGRVFVLLIESLRARTALSADLMPYLTAVRERGMTAQLATVDEASSRGPIFAAFTGREELKGFGALSVFLEPEKAKPSLFTQLTHRGFSSVVYSDQWSFASFRDDLTMRIPRQVALGPESEGQAAQLEHALERFQTKKDHLVIFHLSYLDSVAHRYGVSHLEYSRFVQTLDSLVRELDKKMAPDDTLVIMGDHGHTESGRHSSGLEVPTIFVARGPLFSPGSDAGLLPMTSVRYVLSRALHLSVLKAYEGPRLLNLEPHTAGRGAPNPTSRGLRLRGPHWNPHAVHVVQLFAMALLIGIIFVAFWLTGERLLFSSKPNRSRRPRLLFGGAALVSSGGFLLGWFMPQQQGLFSLVPDYVLNQIWAGILLVGAGGIWGGKWSAAQYGFWIFSVPFLFLYPTILSLGAPAVFAPSWMTFALLQGIEFQKMASLTKETLHSKRQTMLMTGLLCLAVQPFFHVESLDLAASRFVPLIQEIIPISLYPRSLLSCGLTWFLVYRRGQGLWNQILALALSLYVIFLQTRIIPENHVACLGLGLTLLGFSFIVSREVNLGKIEVKAQGLARSFFLSALLVLTFYCIRIGHELRSDLLLVFVAVRIGTMLNARCSRSTEDLQKVAMLTLFFGVVGVGWMTFGWGLGRLEWGVLYDFLPHDLVSRRIGHFLPIILLRYAIPVMIVRLLVSEVLIGKTVLPRREIIFALGVKYGVSLAVLLGVAGSSGGSVMYVSVLSQIAVLLLLAVGLL